MQGVIGACLGGFVAYAVAEILKTVPFPYLGLWEFLNLVQSIAALESMKYWGLVIK